MGLCATTAIAVCTNSRASVAQLVPQSLAFAVENATVVLLSRTLQMAPPYVMQQLTPQINTLERNTCAIAPEKPATHPAVAYYRHSASNRARAQC